MLFGESFFFPYLYLPLWGKEYYDCIPISEYDVYLLGKGDIILEPSPKSERQKQFLEEKLKELHDIEMTEDGHDLGEAEQLSENDQLIDYKDEYYDDLIGKDYGARTQINKNTQNSKNN